MSVCDDINRMTRRAIAYFSFARILGVLEGACNGASHLLVPHIELIREGLRSHNYHQFIIPAPHLPY